MTGTHLEVDLTSSVPPFEQIRRQISEHIAAGHLGPGTRLPTIRTLATDLGIAPGTVARAYRELEAAGLVTTRRRTGTSVAAGAAAPDAAPRRAAQSFVALARAHGLDDHDVLDLVREALAPPAGPAGAPRTT